MGGFDLTDEDAKNLGGVCARGGRVPIKGGCGEWARDLADRHFLHINPRGIAKITEDGLRALGEWVENLEVVEP